MNFELFGRNVLSVECDSKSFNNLNNSELFRSVECIGHDVRMAGAGVGKLAVEEHLTDALTGGHTGGNVVEDLTRLVALDVDSKGMSRHADCQDRKNIEGPACSFYISNNRVTRGLLFGKPCVD